MMEAVVEPVLGHRLKPRCIGFCFGFQLSAAEAKLAAAENKLSNIGTAEGGEYRPVVHCLCQKCILLSMGVGGAVQSDGPFWSSLLPTLPVRHLNRNIYRSELFSVHFVLSQFIYISYFFFLV